MKLRDAPKWMRWQVIYLRLLLVTAIALITAASTLMIVRGGLDYEGVVDLLVAYAVSLVCAAAALLYSYLRRKPLQRRDFAGFVAMNLVLITTNVVLGLFVLTGAVMMLQDDKAYDERYWAHVAINSCIAVIGFALLIFAVDVSRRVAEPIN